MIRKTDRLALVLFAVIIVGGLWAAAWAGVNEHFCTALMILYVVAGIKVYNT